ncbi:hypothetical protein SELMODRAFT_179916 [Selaginella moellendorffii]|uniref:HVA22-like protein n=1 Tax=Selaginella moellendorffii TaxID=88036 RepID=D8SI61_SELML|nr:HVA22-like protein f [Selaginella moellendorffii]XP_024543855.1 HVA22-like protein f [Selaginella moellendorffii]EFJ15918.1 hypothetical protein SELMODRAFT_179916 [Selaginella moellendorffii]|eukprot:XP_002983109.1 HVA22-like protein f [Selaginella moellendorffii]
MGVTLTLLKSLVPYLGPAVMLGYPLYQSIRAIESPFKEDDEQWLTYWVIYSFIALFELAADRVLEMIPIWPMVKILLIFWLILPQFRGACFLYRNYVRRGLYNIQTQKDHLDDEHTYDYNEKQKKLLRMMSSDARVAVAQYISEYGPNAFDKLITSATKQSAKNKTSPRTTPPKTPKSPIRLLFDKAKFHHSPPS